MEIDKQDPFSCHRKQFPWYFSCSCTCRNCSYRNGLKLIMNSRQTFTSGSKHWHQASSILEWTIWSYNIKTCVTQSVERSLTVNIELSFNKCTDFLLNTSLSVLRLTMCPLYVCLLAFSGCLQRAPVWPLPFSLDIQVVSSRSHIYNRYLHLYPPPPASLAPFRISARSIDCPSSTVSTTARLSTRSFPLLPAIRWMCSLNVFNGDYVEK